MLCREEEGALASTTAIWAPAQPMERLHSIVAISDTHARLAAHYTLRQEPWPSRHYRNRWSAFAAIELEFKVNDEARISTHNHTIMHCTDAGYRFL